MSDIGDVLAGIGLVTLLALIPLLIIAGPLVLIWCISLLWGIPPQYDLLHWFGGLVFEVFFLGGLRYTRK